MAYQDLEDSIEDGRPVVLYEFTFGSTIWRYTSADQDIDAGGHTWKAVAIADDGNRQTGEATTDNLTIRASQRIGPSQVFMRTPPSTPILVKIREKHEDAADIVTRYSGEVNQVNWPIPGSCSIACETLSATLSRQGLRMGWQRSCPYALYDPLTCKVLKADFDATFRVQSINGFTIVADSLAAADGYYDGGFITWVHPIRGTEYIPIETHVGTTLVAFSNLGELYVGAQATINPGCDFTPPTCQDVYSNYDNYGGEPHMPGKSPFDGDPVF